MKLFTLVSVVAAYDHNGVWIDNDKGLLTLEIRHLVTRDQPDSGRSALDQLRKNQEHSKSLCS